MDIAFWQTYCIVLLSLNEAFARSKSSRASVTRHRHRRDMDGFVIGGAETNIEKYPHAVCLLQYPQYKFFCGASVLNQYILLTAAHCLDRADKTNSFDAYAGHENLNMVTVIRRVRYFMIHEDYDADWTINDIALIFLNEDLPLGEEKHIKRIIITPKYPFEVKQAEISGWGMTDDDPEADMSPVLKVAARQPIIPLTVCQEKYPDLSDGMMCVGDPKSLTNRPFRGDSGSGLITSNYQLIGVVSYMIMESPGLVIYTNVSSFYDWVVNKTSDTCMPGLNSEL